jgi:hypothetical protein
LALREQGSGCMLMGRLPAVSSPFTSGSRSLSTSADDLLHLFKQAASKSAPSAPAAPAQQPRPVSAGRGRMPTSAATTSSGNWAQQLANQLDDRAIESPASHPAAKPLYQGQDEKKRKFRPARHAFDPSAPRGGSMEDVASPLSRGGRGRRMRGGVSLGFDDARFQDAAEEGEDDDFDMRMVLREEKDDAKDIVSLSSAMDQGGDDDWEAMAAEINAWGKKLQNSLRPHIEVLNKHTKTRRMRRQKYRAFLERCLARREAKRGGAPKPAGWPWPKERDLVYNTDLFVPLNLELKGIEEEGEDLHALLTQQMEDAARAIGHNPSWPLEEKRKLMLDLKRFYEQAVRAGPASYDLFADHRHALDDDDFFGSSGPSSE